MLCYFKGNENYSVRTHLEAESSNKNKLNSITMNGTDRNSPKRIRGKETKTHLLPNNSCIMGKK